MDPRSSTLYQSLEKTSRSIDQRIEQLLDCKKNLEEAEKQSIAIDEYNKTDCQTLGEALQALSTIAEESRALLKSEEQSYESLPLNPASLKVETMLLSDTTYNRVYRYFDESFAKVCENYNESSAQIETHLNAIRKLKRDLEKEIKITRDIKIKNTELMKECVIHFDEYARIRLAEQEAEKSGVDISRAHSKRSPS